MKNIMSESVFVRPKNSAVLTLINQLCTDAVIKRCFAKNVFVQSPKIVNSLQFFED